MKKNKINISDNDISMLFRQQDNLQDMPGQAKNKIENMIRQKSSEFQRPDIKQRIQDLIYLKKPLPVLAISIFFIFISFIILLTIPTRVNDKIISVQNDGNPILIRQNKNQKLHTGIPLQKSDIIQNDAETTSHLRINNNIQVLLYSNTQLQISKLPHLWQKSIELTLRHGEIFVQINKIHNNRAFSVNMKDCMVQAVGTQFIMRQTRDTASILVKSGKLRIKSKKTGQKKSVFFLNSHQKLTINKERIKTESFTGIDFPEIHSFKTGRKIREHTRVNFQLNIQQVKLEYKQTSKLINSHNLELMLPAGSYTFIFSKPGYKNFRLNLLLKKNKTSENIIVLLEKIQPAVTENNAINSSIKKDIVLKNTWQLFHSTFRNNMKTEKIIGFHTANKYLFIQTNNSVLCFDTALSLKWQHTFVKTNNTLIQARIINYRDMVIIPGPDKKITAIKQESGEITHKIDSNENLYFGRNMQIANDSLLIPLSSGIYRLMPITMQIENKPVISLINPLTPLAEKEFIYINSISESNVFCYSSQYEKQWQIKLSASCTLQPLIYDSYLYIFTKNRNIYKIDKNNPSITTKQTLPDIVTANPVLYSVNQKEHHLILLLNNGFLYDLSLDNLTAKSLFQLENEMNLHHYVNKASCILKNRYILIGTESGNIIYYDLQTEKIRDEIELSQSAITTPVYRFQNYLFVGTSNGEIFKLNIE